MKTAAAHDTVETAAAPATIRQHDVVVVGAGPAGLACAATLGARGLPAVVLERSQNVGASWRERYDGLRLNTNRRLSSLPGYRFPRDAGLFPSRDAVVSYLERYAAYHCLDLRPGTEVLRVERARNAWRVRCTGGEFEGGRVVVATGWERVPHMPDWPRRASFAGELIHAASYRNPDPYCGRDVLVIGPGCSGMEIAFQIAEAGAARVRVAVRTPPHLVLRSWGIPADLLAVIGQRQPPRLSDPQARMFRRLSIGDLSAFGLGAPVDGLFDRFERRRAAPTTIDRPVVDAIRQRRIEIVSAVVGFEERFVQLADGSSVQPDAVIAATGYRRGLETLVGHLGVLGPDGTPLVTGTRSDPRAPDLYFVGFDPRIAGTFRQIRLEAERLARVIG